MREIGPGDRGSPGGSGGTGADGRPAAATALPPEDLAALRYRIARLAIDFVSGPPGIAALLRTGLLDGPFTTASLPLDIGYSDNIPAHIRRAVALRDQGLRLAAVPPARRGLRRAPRGAQEERRQDQR